MSGELLQRECNTTGDAALALLIAEHLRLSLQLNGWGDLTV